MSHKLLELGGIKVRSVYSDEAYASTSYPTFCLIRPILWNYYAQPRCFIFQIFSTVVVIFRHVFSG